MDAALMEMVLTAYEETRSDALAQGRDGATADREAVTAAAMCLSSMTGVEDAAARAQVASINPAARLAA